MTTLTELPSRSDVILSQKKKGNGLAAVLPIHYSRALIRAFDIQPIELWGPPRLSSQHGSSHLQPYICSIVHNALSFLKAGNLDIVDVLIVPHACDSLQGFASILIDFIQPDQDVIPIYIPRGRRSSDLAFLAAEFKSVHVMLSKITGRSPDNDKLRECIQREEKADSLLRELHHSRVNLSYSDSEFYKLIRSREYLPAEDFTQYAQEALLNRRTTSVNRIPLILSGILPEPMEMFDTINELGGVVVADDLACCGRRLYPPGDSEDPFIRMAQRIIYGPPDPMKGSSIQSRADLLSHMAYESNARGIVFYEVKFCEPELFDLPILRQMLKDMEIPTIVIETDINDKLSARVINRIEAFLEMIS